MFYLRRVFQSQEGLSLIEILLAMAVVVVLITAFTTALVTGLQSEEEMDKKMQAAGLAETALERIKAFDGNISDFSCQDLDEVVRDTDFQCGFEPSEEPIPGYENLYPVEITIEDKEGNEVFQIVTRLKD